MSLEEKILEERKEDEGLKKAEERQKDPPEVREIEGKNAGLRISNNKLREK